LFYDKESYSGTDPASEGTNKDLFSGVSVSL